MYSSVIPALVAAFSAYSYGPGIYQTWSRLGLTYTPVNTVVNDADLVVIQDTTFCEDLHHHPSSNSIFTACEDVVEIRHSWFPGLGVLKNPLVGQQGKGSIHVIDTKTFKSKRLSFENFEGTFVTHGIDVVSDPERPSEAVYIFAINHIPSQDFVVAFEGDPAKASEEPVKAASQIELFHHVLGTSSVKHVRSIVDPLIRTPNDVFAESPSSIYVTNDHLYREGHLRMLEIIYSGAKWTDTTHVQIDDLTASSTQGIKAEVALTGMHNNNGIGHGRPGEVLIISCADGTLHIAEKVSAQESSLKVQTSVPVPIFIDNPSYFDDPYKTVEYDASSYVLPGITKPFVDVTKHIEDQSANISSAVWQAKRKECKDPKAASSDCWEKRLLFEDDGSRISGASAAVLVGIDPLEEEGKRKAWLFISGFVSRNAIAVKVDV